MGDSFTCRVRFLAGRCVASRPDDRHAPDWPLDPARFYMAAVDTLHALGNRAEHRAALEWLERQPAPTIAFVSGRSRETTQHFVPVNDVAAHPGAGPLTTVEGIIQRKRQPRTFPTTILGEPDEDDCHLAYTWASAPPDGVRNALGELVAGITRLGHSTSPVHCWISDTPPTLPERLIPGGGKGRRTLRCASVGFLHRLETAYSQGEISAQAALAGVRETLAKATTAPAKKAAESALKKLIEATPVSRAPATGWNWESYGVARTGGRDIPPPVHSKFAAEFLVLALDEGPACDLRDTLGLTDLLRATAMKTVTGSTGAIVPRWLSGHEPDGTPSKSVEPHTAFIVLPFAGWEHADGSIKGLAIVRPRGLTPADDRLLGSLCFDATGEERTVRLVAGSAGKWEISRESRVRPPRTLRTDTWTAAPGGAYDWATVTPFAFDRMPKSKIKDNDGEAWDAEVLAIVGEACARIGLPRPESVRVSTAPILEGVPHVRDFPPLPTKPGQSQRLLRHVAIRFAVPVIGPVLLGAGRFKGYGLLKPTTQA